MKDNPHKTCRIPDIKYDDSGDSEVLGPGFKELKYLL